MITRRSRTWTSRNPWRAATLQAIDARLVSPQPVWVTAREWPRLACGAAGTTVDVWPVEQASPTSDRIMMACNEKASAKGIL